MSIEDPRIDDYGRTGTTTLADGTTLEELSPDHPFAVASENFDKNCRGLFDGPDANGQFVSRQRCGESAGWHHGGDDDAPTWSSAWLVNGQHLVCEDCSAQIEDPDLDPDTTTYLPPRVDKPRL